MRLKLNVRPHPHPNPSQRPAYPDDRYRPTHGPPIGLHELHLAEQWTWDPIQKDWVRK